MAEPDDKPPEQKPTPNAESIDEALWEIPFARSVKPFFIQEGKAVKNGWVAIIIVVSIAVWQTHHWTSSGIDTEKSNITNYFIGQISELKGQLSDAKQERDKYQLMVVPFQAAALKIYTNEPLEGRLDLLAGELGEMSKQAQIELWINGTTNLILTDGEPGDALVVSNFITLADRKIRIGILNKSKYPAIHANIDFLVPLGPTNFSLPGWDSQPAETPRYSNWRYDSEHSVPRNCVWNISTIEVNTNYSGNFFQGAFTISADNAETKQYYISFTVGTN